MKRLLLATVLSLMTTACGSGSSTQPGLYTTKGNATIAISEEALNEAIGYANQSDWKALEQMAQQGRIAFVGEGVKVYLEGCAGVACSTVKVRREGETQIVYMIRESLNQP